MSQAGHGLASLANAQSFLVRFASSKDKPWYLLDTLPHATLACDNDCMVLCLIVCLRLLTRQHAHTHSRSY